MKKIKKVAASLMAGAMALSMAIPASAVDISSAGQTLTNTVKDGQLTFNSTVHQGVIKIQTPNVTDGFKVNPYQLNYKIPNTKKTINDGVVSPEYQFVSESDSDLAVKLQAQVTIESSGSANAARLVTENWTEALESSAAKQAFLYVELKTQNDDNKYEGTWTPPATVKGTDAENTETGALVLNTTKTLNPLIIATIPHKTKSVLDKTSMFLRFNGRTHNPTTGTAAPWDSDDGFKTDLWFTFTLAANKYDDDAGYYPLADASGIYTFDPLADPTSGTTAKLMEGQSDKGALNWKLASTKLQVPAGGKANKFTLSTISSAGDETGGELTLAAAQANGLKIDEKDGKITFPAYLMKLDPDETNPRMHLTYTYINKDGQQANWGAKFATSAAVTPYDHVYDADSGTAGVQAFTAPVTSDVYLEFDDSELLGVNSSAEVTTATSAAARGVNLAAIDGSTFVASDGQVIRSDGRSAGPSYEAILQKDLINKLVSDSTIPSGATIYLPLQFTYPTAEGSGGGNPTTATITYLVKIEKS